jgi:tetratricopeptide (TPR) repeat protein
MVWLGSVYLDLGRADEAEPLFSKAASLSPQSVAALVGQGRVALAQHRFAQAVETLERALSIDPRASAVHYPLALAYRGVGDTTNAEAHLRQRGGVEVGPPDPRLQAIGGLLHSAVSYEKLGIRALDGGDWSSAAAAFRQALELRPSDASLHHRLGTALSLSGDAAGASAQLQQAIRLSPTYAPSHFSLGVLLASSGQDSDAVEQFAAAVRSDPAYADARLQLAAALIRLRRYDEARAQVVEGVKHNPDRPEFSRALEQFQRRR